MARYILDASALLMVINSEPGYEKILDYLPNAAMSVVNIAEVASVLVLLDMPINTIESLINSLIPNIIVLDTVQAYQIAKLRHTTKKYGLSLGDRCCLALGKIKKFPVITADKVWKKLNIDVDVILAR